MNLQLADTIGLVCPSCRRPDLAGNSSHRLRLNQAEKVRGEYILEGELICVNERCGRRFPIIGGVPFILRDAAVLERAAGQARGSPSSPHPAADSLLPTYIDAHYEGDCRPSLIYPGSLSNVIFWQTMKNMMEMAGPHHGLAIDLGCAAGRFSFELAARFETVVGMDTNYSHLAFAAALQRGEETAFQRPLRAMAREKVSLNRSGCRNVLFILSDALDPPLPAESALLVGALNLIDSISSPMILLGQMDALLQHEGTLLLTSPYSWNSGVCPAARWLEEEQTAPGQVLKELLVGARAPENGFAYRILFEQADIPWILPLCRNQFTLFQTQAIMAKKI